MNHESSNYPNASDQPLSTPHTLRSFILARLTTYLDWTRMRGSLWLEKIYIRLLAVAQVLLDPERLPEGDVVVRSVIVHGDLTARNLMVRVDGGVEGVGEAERGHDCDGHHHHGDSDWVVAGDWIMAGASDRLQVHPMNTGLKSESNQRTERDQHPTCFTSYSYPSPHPRTISSVKHQTSTSSSAFKITGVLDWDVTEALPPLAAYTSPNWFWKNPNAHSSTIWDDEGDPDLDDEMDIDSLVRARFITSIEDRIPGYMDTVRRGRGSGIKRLMGFARFKGEGYLGAEGG